MLNFYIRSIAKAIKVRFGVRFGNWRHSRSFCHSRVAPACLQAQGAKENGNLALRQSRNDHHSSSLRDFWIPARVSLLSRGIAGMTGRARIMAAVTLALFGASVATAAPEIKVNEKIKLSHEWLVYRGDITVIGNSVLCFPKVDLGGGIFESDAHGVPPTVAIHKRLYDKQIDGKYNYEIGLNGKYEGECADHSSGLYAADSDNMLYANVQPNGSLVGSINESNTMATLTIPSDAKITQAWLYWSGQLPRKAREKNEFPVNAVPKPATGNGFAGDGNDALPLKWTADSFLLPSGDNYKTLEKFSKVWLKIPYASDYQEVTAEKIFVNARIEAPYTMKADVTHLINSDPSKQSGEYFVKGVQAKLHGTAWGTWGGWTLIVVYESPSASMRYISLHDGLEPLTAAIDGGHLMTFSGFSTPKAGDVNSTFIYVSSDADRGNDCAVMNYGGGLSSFFVHETCLPNKTLVPYQAGGKGVFLDHSSESTITVDAIPGDTFGTGFRGVELVSNPNGKNGRGHDVHTFKLNNVLTNGQSATNFHALSNDSQSLEIVAFSTVIHSPYLGEIKQDVTIGECADDRNLKGSQLEYTLTFKNVGSVSATGVELIDDFAEQGIMGLIDHTKTTVPILKLDGVEATATQGSCAKTSKGILCELPAVAINQIVTVDFNITIAESMTAADFNKPGGFVNVAKATYKNPSFDPPETIDQPATVNNPVFISADHCYKPTCTDKNLNIVVKMFDNNDSGLFIVKPYQAHYTKFLPEDKDPFDQPMLVYCKGLKNYKPLDKSTRPEVWIPLVMSMPSNSNDQPITSNFRFNFGASGSLPNLYYDPRHDRAPLFDKILAGKKQDGKYWKWSDKSDDGNNTNPIYGMRINIDSKSITLHDSMYKDGKFIFANINLIGTALAIDESKTTIICPSEEKIPLSHYGQVIKTNLLYNEGQQCEAKNLTFKQVNGKGNSDFAYKYAALKSPRGDAKADKSIELYFSCRDIKQYGNVKGGDRGYYLIDPIDNRGVPFTAYCEMPKDSIKLGEEGELITTSFLSLDGRLVYDSSHITKDTCTNLGLTFFVPTSKPLFQAMKKRLQEQKKEWQGYTRTNNDWQKTMTGTDYNAVPLFQEKTYIVWPYGPFGLFNAKDGKSPDDPDSGAACDTIGCGAPLHSKAFEKKDRKTIDQFGWITIFDPSAKHPAVGNMLQNIKDKEPSLKNVELEKTFWISDENCPYGNKNPPTQEPNGDYKAYTWLNFVYDYKTKDTEGNVIHCNDQLKVASNQTELPPYPYSNYSCIGLDSYFVLNSRVPQGFDAWDKLVTDPSDSSKKVPHLYTKMVATESHIKIGLPSPTDDDKNFKGYVKSVKLISKDTGVMLDESNAKKPFPFNNTVGAWHYASHTIILQNIAAKEAYINLTVCAGDLPSDPPKEGEIEDCKEFNSTDTFSIRPTELTVASGSSADKLIAGKPFGLTTATKDYKHANVAALGSPFDFNDTKDVEKVVDGVKVGRLGDITVTGVAPTSPLITATYSEVGKINVTGIDKSWTTVDKDNDDCIKDKNVIDPDKDGKIGCNIGIKDTLTFTPSKFVITSLTTNNAHGDYTFYDQIDSKGSGDSIYKDSKSSAVIDIDIQACRYDENGSCPTGDDAYITKNYSKDLYSNDITPKVSFTPEDHSRIVETILPAIADGDQAKVMALMPTDKDLIDKDKWTSGKAPNVTMEFNFPRATRVSINPLIIGDDNLTLEINDSVHKHVGAERNNSGELRFVYGRFISSDVSTAEEKIDVPMYVEFYCPSTFAFGGKGCGTLLGAVEKGDTTNWWRITSDTTEANAASNTVLNLSSKPKPKANDPYNVEYGATSPRPRRFILHLDIPDYLWYHNYANPFKVVDPLSVDTSAGCFDHPCYTIEFLPKGGAGWGGTGDEDMTRRYEDNSSKRQKIQRLMW